jgi:hypothetical protein
MQSKLLLEAEWRNLMPRRHHWSMSAVKIWNAREGGIATLTLTRARSPLTTRSPFTA